MLLSRDVIRCAHFATLSICLFGATAWGQATTLHNHFEKDQRDQLFVEEQKPSDFRPWMYPVKAFEDLVLPQEYIEGMAEAAKNGACVAADVPPNDLCDQPEMVGTNYPEIVMGTTCGATCDVPAPACSSDTSVACNGPGVWYNVLGTGNTMTVTTCDGVDDSATANFDTKISVYCAPCDGTTMNLVCVGGNNDDDENGCEAMPPMGGSRRSTVTWCSQSGAEYLVLVHGSTQGMPALPPQGDFTMVVLDDGVPCQEPDGCDPVVGEFECPVDSISENEPVCSNDYVDETNGGCNSNPPVFGTIECGQTVCGTSGTYMVGVQETRDTDWFAFTLAQPMIVTWEVTADFHVLFGIVNNMGNPVCQAMNPFLVSAARSPNMTDSVMATLDAGTWWVSVSPSGFSGTPCGREWYGTLTCEPVPTGACCTFSGICQDDMTEAACTAMGGTYQGDGTECVDVFCPATPLNDECEDAIEVDVPSLTAGTTTGASLDMNAPDCEHTVTAPGVWHSVIGTGTVLTASLCSHGYSAQYDSKLTVYCAECDGLTCVASDDDACGIAAGAEVTWCSQAGVEYLILVHGFGGATGDYMLALQGSDDLCCAEVRCIPEGACCFDDGTCEVMMQSECESMGGTYGGNNSDCKCEIVYSYSVEYCQSPFEDISSTGLLADLGDDQSIGVGIGFDFDFYGETTSALVLDSNGYLTTVGSPSTFSNAQIPNPLAPNGLIAPLWDDLNPGAGGTIHIEQRGMAPNRRFIVQWTDVPQFGETDANTFQVVLYEGFNDIEYRYRTITPEAAAGDYTIGIERGDGYEGLSVAGDAIADGDCIRFECLAYSAPVDVWKQTFRMGGFEDISGYGTHLDLGDDDGAVVPIGFEFLYGGILRTDAGVSSNGYITFGTSLNIFNNDTIPDMDVPNNFIAPLWDDLAPNAGGAVQYATIGAEPDRRFIVQWTDVPQFGMADMNTFQVILDESDGSIYFKYLSVTPEGFAGDYTIGLENADGTDGVQLDAGLLGPDFCVQFRRAPATECPDSVPPDLQCDVRPLPAEGGDSAYDALADALGDEFEIPDPVLLEVRLKATDLGCAAAPSIDAYVDYGCGTETVHDGDTIILFCWPDGHDCPLCFSMYIDGTLVVATDSAVLHASATDGSGNTSYCDCVFCGDGGGSDRPIDIDDQPADPKPLERPSRTLGIGGR